MPNAEGFIIDDREETEAHFWTNEPCMENCKDSVEITMRATVLDVTPDEGNEEEAMAEEAPAAEAEEVQMAAAEPAVDAPAADAAATGGAALDPELVAEGEKVYKKCQSCHQVGEGAKNRTGPILNGIVGHPIGAVEGFRYSKVFEELNAEGKVWTEEELAAFLADPRGYAKGTKMSFAGLRKEDDIAAVTAYLQSFSE